MSTIWSFTDKEHIPIARGYWVWRMCRSVKLQDWTSSIQYFGTYEDARQACEAQITANGGSLTNPGFEVVYIGGLSPSGNTAHMFKLVGGVWFYRATVQSGWDAFKETFFGWKNPEAVRANDY
jgi:hypothetical protein